MGKKLIIAFVIFAVIGVGIFYLLTMGNVGEEYNTAKVIKDEVSQYVQDTGTISSKNIRRYYGNGMSKIEELPVKLGDQVKKGDLLVKYEDNLDIEIQKVKKQIEAMEASYREVLVGIDMESVSSARVEISSIRNQLSQAETDKDRTETLYNNGAVSLSELEQAKNQVNQLKSNLSIAQNNYSQLKKETSENVVEKYEAEIEVLNLTLESLEDSKDDYMLYSDVEGIVTEINTFTGDMPSPAIMMIEIQDPTEKVVLVDFMVEDAINVKPGYDAQIIDMNVGIEIGGLKVNQVYPKAFVTMSELGVEENRQTVEIGLSSEGDTLAYGLEVETKVLIGSEREVLLVPVGAVYYKDLKQYVEVLEGGDPIEKEITTGIKVNGNIEVITGLVEGEEVVLNYQED